MLSDISLLVIEDNADDTFFLTKTLGRGARPSFVITVAPSVTEALVLMEELSFDLILVDLPLPPTSGFLALEQVAERAPGTPVVVITSDEHDNLRSSILAAGAQDCLIKGEIGGRNLARALLQAIERKKLQMVTVLHQSRLDAFFAGAPVAMGMVDSQFRFIKVNEVLARLQDIVPGLKAEICPLIENVIRTGRPHTSELHTASTAAPGVPGDWLVTYFPITPQVGNGITEIALIAVEITGQKAGSA